MYTLDKSVHCRLDCSPLFYVKFILVKVFTKMLSENKRAFNDGLRRLDVGLSRLMEAKLMVGSMQQELVELGPQIEQKAKDTEKLMMQLKKDTEAVNQASCVMLLGYLA